MKWFLALAVTLAVAVAACAGQPDVTPPPAQSATALAGEVYVDAAADHAFRVIEPISGRVVRTLPAGTPSPDWRRLYRLSAGALEVLDPLTGSLASTHPAPGWAQAVWTSANGRWLVFSQSGAGDRFQVQDAGWSAAPVSVDLHGSFTFDGISGDGQRLFLLERQDADHYQVRMYDVPGHALAPYVIVDKTDPSEPMSGRAVAGYATGDGEMQLTLYQRAKDHAFVHALPIGEAIQVAYCVDLPGPSEGWAFAPAPDGRRFYAVNVSAGRVVELTARNDGPPDLRQADDLRGVGVRRRGTGLALAGEGRGQGPGRPQGDGAGGGARRRLRGDRRHQAGPARSAQPGGAGRGAADHNGGCHPAGELSRVPPTPTLPGVNRKGPQSGPKQGLRPSE